MPATANGCEVWRRLEWLVHHVRLHVPIHDTERLSDSLIHTYKSQYAQDTQYEMALRGRRIVNATHQEAQAVSYAHEVEFVVDLMPLMHDPSLDVAEYVRQKLHNFESDVMNRVLHFGRIGG